MLCGWTTQQHFIDIETRVIGKKSEIARTTTGRQNTKSAGTCFAGTKPPFSTPIHEFWRKFTKLKMMKHFHHAKGAR